MAGSFVNMLAKQSIEEKIITFCAENNVLPTLILIKKFSKYSYPNIPPLSQLTQYEYNDLIITSIVEVQLDGKTLDDIKRDYIYFCNQTDLELAFFDNSIIPTNYNPYDYTYTSTDVKNLTQFAEKMNISNYISPQVGSLTLTYGNKSTHNIKKIDSSIDKIQTKIDNKNSQYGYSFDITEVVTYNRKMITKMGSPLTDLDMKWFIENLELNTTRSSCFYNKIPKAIYKILPGYKIPSTTSKEPGILFYGSDIIIHLSDSTIEYPESFNIRHFESFINRGNYKLSNHTDTSVDVKIYIYNKIIDLHVFQHICLLDRTMRYYINVTDSDSKKGNIADIGMKYKITRTPPISGLIERKHIFVEFSILNTTSSRNGMPVDAVIISANSVSGPLSKLDFINNIQLLIGYYLFSSKPIIEQYKQFFGKNNINVRKELTNLQTLQLLKPLYFGRGYSESCVGENSQPLLITENNYSNLSPKIKNKSAMKFSDPKHIEGDNPVTVYLSCESRSENPVIYIKDDKPCCKKSSAGPSSIHSISSVLAKDMVAYLNESTTTKSIFGTAKISRKGIEHGNNSLKYAIQSAAGVHIPQQIKATTPFRQSMYWYTIPEIKDYMGTSHDWDSDYVVDGLGLILGFNIIILHHVDKKIEIRIPNCDFLYYRTFYEEYPTIFIYRYSYLGKVYYEPIISEDKSQFDKTITKSIFKHLSSISITSVYDTFSKTNTEAKRFFLEDLPIKYNIQIIDSKGKLRGSINESGETFLFHHPRDPVVGKAINSSDLSFSHTPNIDNAKMRNSLIRNEDGILEWKQVPYLVSRNKSYTYVNHKEVINFDFTNIKDQTRSILLQIISWLYTNYPKEFARNFKQKNIIIDTEISYDLSNIDELFPTAINYADAIKYLEKYNITKNNQFVLPSKTVFDGIIQFITFMYYSPALPITNLYTNQDYISHGSGMILEGEKQKTLYENTILYNPVKFTLDKAIFSYKSPIFLLLNVDGEPKPFLLQNVNPSNNDSHVRSCNCSIQWYSRKVNTGYNTNVLDKDVYDKAKNSVSICKIEDNFTLTFLSSSIKGTIIIIKHGEKSMYSSLLNL